MRCFKNSTQCIFADFSRLLVVSVVVILWLPTVSWGAVPQLINYQGLLRDNLGSPVTDSTYSVTFTIYDQLTNGNNLWSETQGVPTSEGSFSVQLGTSLTLPDNLFDDTVRYIGIKVNPELNEMAPRQRIVSTPYSYRVRTVDGATGGIISGDVSIQSDLSVAGGMDAEGIIIQGGLNETSVIIQGGLNETGIIIQGGLGQTNKLMEIKNNAGTPLVSVNPDGGMNAKNMSLGIISPGPPQVTPLLIQGAPGRTANMMEIKNSAEEVVASFDDGGALFSRFGTFAHLVQCYEGLNVGADFHVSGNSEIGGQDFIVSASGSQFLNPVGIGTPPSTAPDVLLRVQSGTVTHELGHNLSIFHGGAVATPPSDDFLQAFDETGNKVASIDPSGHFNASAVSVMNYVYTGGGINVGGDAVIDGSVSIGTAIGSCKLHVEGGISTAVTIVSSSGPGTSITLNENHSIVLCNAVLDPITVNLPTAAGIAGCQYTVKLIFQNVVYVLIDPFGNELIEGSATYSLNTLYQYVTFVSDGTSKWWIIANN